MLSNMRFRTVYIGLGSILVLLVHLLTDPQAGLIHALPFGASTIATLVILTKAILYNAVLHLTRKGLMDYFDMEEFMNKAKETSEGAGQAIIGAGLYTIAMAIVTYAATVA